MTSAIAAPSPARAVMLATPSPTPVTRPPASTVAIVALLDSHANPASSTAIPFSSNPSAVSCSVLPNAIVAAGGEISTDDTSCVTVTSADPEAGPALAVIVATPLATPVTRPDASTVATEVSLLPHVTVAPAIAAAYWSRTSAVSWTVAPSAVSSAAAGLTASVVGRGGSGSGGGLVGLSPHAHARVRPERTAYSRMIARSRIMEFVLGRPPEVHGRETPHALADPLSGVVLPRSTPRGSRQGGLHVSSSARSRCRAPASRSHPWGWALAGLGPSRYPPLPAFSGTMNCVIASSPSPTELRGCTPAESIIFVSMDVTGQNAFTRISVSGGLCGQPAQFRRYRLRQRVRADREVFQTGRVAELGRNGARETVPREEDILGRSQFAEFRGGRSRHPVVIHGGMLGGPSASRAIGGTGQPVLEERERYQ